MKGRSSNQEPNTIVVRFPNWIGDCVMALPALRALYRCQPGSDIYVVAKDYLRGFFQNIEEIKDIFYIPNRLTLKGLIRSADELRALSFVAGILFTNSFASALLFRLGGIGNLIGYKKDGRSLLLSQKLKFPHNNKHHTTFYLDLVGEYCALETLAGGSNQLVVTKEEKVQIKQKLASLGIETEREWFGFSTSAAYGSAKEWLPENYTATIHRLIERYQGCQILLFGSSGEFGKIERIRQGMNGQVHNLAGKLSLRQSIEAISLCRLFISNDSGLMHVADSLKVPQVAIFGPTQPHKTAPKSPLAKILHHPVRCAPCLHRQCPKSHECMASVRVSEVMEVVDSLWQEALSGGADSAFGASGNE